MARRFNVAGPCRPDDHYMLPPQERLGALRPLVDEKAYFVVHAPRQTGKTTGLAELAELLTAEGRFAAVLASCKVASGCGDDVDRGLPMIVWTIDSEARAQLPQELHPESPRALADIAAGVRLLEYLQRWCRRCPRPVVLFLDEVDSLTDGTLLSVLSQLHTGFRSRPQRFPWSMALIGVRDVRDYKIRRRDGRGDGGTSSPFNIKTTSVRLRDFTADEVAALLGQHTADTGQRFTDEAVTRVFGLTRGQPWLVNALARQIVDVEVRERTDTVELGHVEVAKEALIARRDTHLDSLIELLREDRVKRVVEPILAGQFVSRTAIDDDVDFLEDLGLVAGGSGGFEIANPIYREVVPRALTSLIERELPVVRPSYIAADGSLRLRQLLDGFVDFWREHAAHFLHRHPYSEAAAQLIFMAWLQRVVNGGTAAGVASIEREYAVGSGRVDVVVRWPLPDGAVERFAFELKVWHDERDDPLEAGLEQLTDYLARLALTEGTLLLFDRRRDAPRLPERVSREERHHRGSRIVVLRL